MSHDAHDLAEQDVGTVIELEHVNVGVPDFDIATQFYVDALGLTREPYLDLGPDLVWINVGRQQFHLVRGDAQVVRGTIELVVPSCDALLGRLRATSDRLAATAFAFDGTTGVVDVRGPWGNRFRCREAAPGARVQLGLTGVELSVPPGSAPGIRRFYEQILGAPASVQDGCCTVVVGPGQALRFSESDGEARSYDGDHIAIYLADFSGPHRRLAERGLLVGELADCEYRFTSIVDPDDGTTLFEIEHEVRSLHHPLRGRPLVNRNPDQQRSAYVPGRDPFIPDDGADAALRAALGTVG